MSKNVKIILGAVIGVFVFLILILLFIKPKAQDTVSTAPITLHIWQPFIDSSQMQDLISDYQTKHPNVTIDFRKPECSDEVCSDYQKELLNSLARGDGPDIYGIHNTWLPQYLDKVASSTNFTYKEFKDSFIDTVVSDFTRDQKIYGVALNVDTLGLYYNKDLLNTFNLPIPPQTWDELARYSRIIKQRNKQSGYFDRSGVAMGTVANVYRPQDILYLLMLQKGVKPWSSDGLQPTFANSDNSSGQNVNPGLEALQFYTSFANPNSENYTWNNLSNDSVTAFVQGHAAFFYGYSYKWADIVSKNANLNFDVAKVPQPQYGGTVVNYANYWGEVVSSQSKNKKVAWDFLKFITQADELQKFNTQTHTPSSRKDIIAKQLDDPQIGIFASSALTAKSFLKPDETSMDKIMKDMINDVLLKGANPEDALNSAQVKASGLSQVRY